MIDRANVGIASRLRRYGKGALVAARWLWFTVRYAPRRIYIHPTSKVSRRSVLKTNGGGSIRIGAFCEIHDFAMIMTYGGRVEIGDHCSVNPFTIIYGHGGTKIGNGVRIAAHSVVIPANHERRDGPDPVLEGIRAKGIKIDDHVWIAAGCRILDGVTVGRGATIGAGSVVTTSIDENVTAIGVPARPLRRRDEAHAGVDA